MKRLAEWNTNRNHVFNQANRHSHGYDVVSNPDPGMFWK